MHGREEEETETRFQIERRLRDVTRASGDPGWSLIRGQNGYKGHEWDSGPDLTVDFHFHSLMECIGVALVNKIR